MRSAGYIRTFEVREEEKGAREGLGSRERRREEKGSFALVRREVGLRKEEAGKGGFKEENRNQEKQ